MSSRIQELAKIEISEAERHRAQEVLSSQKVAVFIVAYNAEKKLEAVFDRIPAEIRDRFAEIFVIDDSSQDRTYEVAQKVKLKYPATNIQAYRTPFNRGYGGNQKLGYLYSLEKAYDIVILLHGDGQYAPEYLPRVIAGFADGADAVFASRMMNKTSALKGGMPLYKWVGNQVLTFIENKFLNTNLSEFHTGFRAYRTSALRKIPFIYNSGDFHFDTEIIIQAVATGWNIREVSIPTYYGDEVCHVNGVKYAWDCIKAVIKSRLVQMGLYYHRGFDFALFENDNYQFKKSPHSLHQYVLTHAQIGSDMDGVELGANRGIMSSRFAEKARSHCAVDIMQPDLAGTATAMSMDLNSPFSEALGRERFDYCVALDVVEHMNRPEAFLEETFKILKPHSKLYISTANIAYLPIRISLLLGQFNYGKRGILDRTHTRLFTIRTLTKMLEQYGFRVEKKVGFTPPISDLVGKGFILRAIEAVHLFLSRRWPTMFSFNFLIVATRTDDLQDVFEKTIRPS
ncbi:MAG TPA: bifunctional glycosyltransferase/class I SAM-dependent methyltransferase [Bdellovibrionota bacterium]|nr:bifunctional glycosyltransferase/class I SAM-dependent methyltransferase [Bdellovibrionota bacterium]